MSEQPLLRSVRAALIAAGAAGARIVVGCSGGPDSTALLLALSSLQGELALELHAVCIDHGLRAAAGGEAAGVLALCAALEVPAEVVRVTVAPGPSLQQAARQARYAALLDVARRQGASAVATGHTRSDQAETLLMRLVGGAGLRGLAAMAPERPLAPGVRLLRPLLAADRGAVLAFLAEAGLQPVHDPSNDDRRFLRVRVRHELLPLLRRERPDIDGHLGDLAEQLRADADYLDALAADALGRLQQGETLDAAGLAALPPALQARVLARWLGPLSRRHVDAVAGLCRSLDGSQSLDLPGRRLERRYDRLHAVPARPSPPPLVWGEGAGEGGRPPLASVFIPAPGTYTLGATTLLLRPLGPGEAPAPSPTRLLFTPAFPLELRHPRPGDRLRLPAGRRKVSDLLIDARVPRHLRPAAVLLCRNGEILWLVGVRQAAAFGPAAGPDPPLLAEWLDPQEVPRT